MKDSIILTLGPVEVEAIRLAIEYVQGRIVLNNDLHPFVNLNMLQRAGVVLGKIERAKKIIERKQL